MPKKYGLSRDALCCCEYENMEGERSHIMACCCDCNALDESFDRCITCKQVPSSTRHKLLQTIQDRCRIPGLFGGGAVKLNLDVITPVFSIPIFILIGTHSLPATILVLSFIPVFMLLFYQSWRKLTNKPRTKFFFVWGLTSLLCMYLTFRILVTSLQEVLLWEDLLLFTGVVLLLYLVFKIRNNPGILKTAPVCTKSEIYMNGKEKTLMEGDCTPVKNGENTTAIGKLHANAVGEITLEMPADKVTWVDSRPIVDGLLKTWCSVCLFTRPPRSGHCHICASCIAVRDHHCVWIDICIGARNHRAFLAVILLFIFCGYFGANLTLTTICTSKIYLDWILLPDDCKFIYSEFTTSLCFVSACYTILVTSLMVLLFIYQVILISQNITSQELHMASQRGMTRFGLIVVNNVHNVGFFRNWLQFFASSRYSLSKIPV